MKGLTCNLVLSVIVISFGSGIQHGYNIAVVNTPSNILRAWISEGHRKNYGTTLPTVTLDLIWSTLTSIYYLGGIIGAFLVGVILKTIGPRKGLMVNSGIVLVGVVFEVLPKYYELLIVGRLVIGVSSGVSSGVCSVYSCDMAPKRLRGAVGGTYQACLFLGMLIASVVTMHWILGREGTWKYLMAMPVVPAVLQFAALVFVVPDSPRFLLMRGDDRGKEVLRWLRNDEVGDEVLMMQTELDTLKHLPRITWKDLHREPLLRKPLICVVVLVVAFQMCGIVATGIFSNFVFVEEAGLSFETMEYVNLCQPLVSMISTMVTTAVLVEKHGRKPLLISSFSVMAASQLVLLFSLIVHRKWCRYVSVLAAYVFIYFYGMGVSIPKFLPSEMFPQNAKPLAQTITGGVNWIMMFVVVLGFIPLDEVFGYYVFYFYFVSNILAIIYVVYFVPETRNKTLPEIQEFYKRKYDWP